MSAQPVKILFIAGAGRSGSTLLARLLGQQPGWFDGGEIFRFPENILQDRGCGCGAPMSQCPVWHRIVVQAGLDNIQRPQVEALSWRSQSVRNRHYLLRSPARVDARVLRDMGDYLATVESVYRAIAEVAGARLIVDSSKSPVHGRFLQLIEGFDVRVVHLVRDPRAVAYSWARRHKTGQRQASLINALHSWVRWNHLASRLWGGGKSVPYMLLRYEDFVAQPARALAAIAALAGEDASWSTSLRGNGELWLEPTHHLSGNVGKHASGSVNLSLDQEWRHHMSGFDRTIATAWCLPWLQRYGYAAGLASSA